MLFVLCTNVTTLHMKNTLVFSQSEACNFLVYNLLLNLVMHFFFIIHNSCVLMGVQAIQQCAGCQNKGVKFFHLTLLTQSASLIFTFQLSFLSKHFLKQCKENGMGQIVCDWISFTWLVFDKILMQSSFQLVVEQCHQTTYGLEKERHTIIERERRRVDCLFTDQL